MIFFQKYEMQVCGKHLMADWMKKMYGEPSAEMLEKIGLPTDIYEAAAMKFMVLDYAKSPTLKFTMNILHGIFDE